LLDICWHYTSTGRGLISGASPTTRISRYSPARTIHNAPPTSRFDKLPAANPYASQIDAIARDSTNGSLEHYLDASGTTAFLVIHDHELLYEKYFDGYDKELHTDILLDGQVVRIGARRDRYGRRAHKER
jgi:hypothetical protein